MNSNADNTLAPQFWEVTFLGGTADLEADLENEAIAPQAGSSSLTPKGVQLPLAMTSEGDRVWIVNIKGGHRMVRRLMDVGIVQGCEITIVSRTESGSVIVALQGCRIGLGAGMAHRVMVTTLEQGITAQAPPQEPTQVVSGEADMTATTLTLGALTVGQSGRIVGYKSGSHAYRGKLLSMGLTPGTHFTITRQAPMGDPVDIEVRGYHLSLRKGEAATLQVELISREETTHES
ncbi:MAG: FeoA family protein [Cyanobacteria bacterium P01_D01_bin.44]